MHIDYNLHHDKVSYRHVKHNSHYQGANQCHAEVNLCHGDTDSQYVNENLCYEETIYILPSCNSSMSVFGMLGYLGEHAQKNNRCNRIAIRAYCYRQNGQI